VHLPSVCVCLCDTVIGGAAFSVTSEILKCPLLESFLDSALAEEPGDTLLHLSPALRLLLRRFLCCFLPVVLRPICLRFLALTSGRKRLPEEYAITKNDAFWF